ncbi:MAG: HEAT repeat domain-containing protein [Moorellaceae bacterium]
MACNKDTSVARLAGALGSLADPMEKVRVISELGCIGTEEATGVLARALMKEEENLVREAIISALLLCDTEAVIKEMTELLNQERDTRARVAALEVLAYKCWGQGSQQ